MTIPPDIHCPEPPGSDRLNWAMVPLVPHPSLTTVVRWPDPICWDGGAPEPGRLPVASGVVRLCRFCVLMKIALTE